MQWWGWHGMGDIAKWTPPFSILAQVEVPFRSSPYGAIKEGTQDLDRRNLQAVQPILITEIKCLGKGSET